MRQESTRCDLLARDRIIDARSRWPLLADASSPRTAACSSGSAFARSAVTYGDTKDRTTDAVSPGAGVSALRTDVAPRVWHAGQQQDAADEVRASRWRPSQLILVFDGPSRRTERVAAGLRIYYQGTLYAYRPPALALRGVQPTLRR